MTPPAAVAEVLQAERAGREWTRSELAARASVCAESEARLEIRLERSEFAGALTVLEAPEFIATALPSIPAVYDIRNIDLDARIDAVTRD